MIVAQSADTQQNLVNLGLPGLAFVVIVLAGVIVFLYRKIDRIQEQRITDAKEFGNKLVEPLEKVRVMSEQQQKTTDKMYEILRDSKQGN